MIKETGLDRSRFARASEVARSPLMVGEYNARAKERGDDG